MQAEAGGKRKFLAQPAATPSRSTSDDSPEKPCAETDGDNEKPKKLAKQSPTSKPKSALQVQMAKVSCVGFWGGLEWKTKAGGN